MVEQILLNLLKNAVEACSRGGTVTIATGRADRDGLHRRAGRRSRPRRRSGVEPVPALLDDQGSGRHRPRTGGEPPAGPDAGRRPGPRSERARRALASHLAGARSPHERADPPGMPGCCWWTTTRRPAGCSPRCWSARRTWWSPRSRWTRRWSKVERGRPLRRRAHRSADAGEERARPAARAARAGSRARSCWCSPRSATPRRPARRSGRAPTISSASRTIWPRCGRRWRGRSAGGELAGLRRDSGAQTAPRGGRATGGPALVGHSPAIIEVMKTLARVAPSQATVLVLGETGTGKELVARTVHRYSERAERRFVAVNCSALAEGLLESELFGHVRGAFTGAGASRPGLFREADRGTLFLDEIGDVSPGPPGPTAPGGAGARDRAGRLGDADRRGRPGASPRPTGTCRSWCARAGSARTCTTGCNVVTLTLPPLRARRQDVPLLIDHFLRDLAAPARARPGGGRSRGPAAAPRLRLAGQHPRAAERARARDAAGGAGRDRSRAPAARRARAARDRPRPRARPRPARGATREESPLRSLEEIDREHVLRVLTAMHGNRDETSRVLGISRRTLSRMIQRWNLPRRRPDRRARLSRRRQSGASPPLEVPRRGSGTARIARSPTGTWIAFSPAYRERPLRETAILPRRTPCSAHSPSPRPCSWPPRSRRECARRAEPTDTSQPRRCPAGAQAPSSTPRSIAARPTPPAASAAATRHAAWTKDQVKEAQAGSRQGRALQGQDHGR